MYSCEAEHSHELSFPQGAHFSNGEQRQQKAHIKQYASADKLLFCEGTHNMSPSKGLLASVHRTSVMYWQHTVRSRIIPTGSEGIQL